MPPRLPNQFERINFEKNFERDRSAALFSSADAVLNAHGKMGDTLRETVTDWGQNPDTPQISFNHSPFEVAELHYRLRTKRARDDQTIAPITVEMKLTEPSSKTSSIYEIGLLSLDKTEVGSLDESGRFVRVETNGSSSQEFIDIKDTVMVIIHSIKVE